MQWGEDTKYIDVFRFFFSLDILIFSVRVHEELFAIRMNVFEFISYVEMHKQKTKVNFCRRKTYNQLHTREKLFAAYTYQYLVRNRIHQKLQIRFNKYGE